METALKTKRRFNWLGSQWLAYFFILISMLYWFFAIDELESYRPWKFRFAKAASMALIGHLGLWLAMIQTQSKLRFLTIAILIPTMGGLSFLWWLVHPALGILAFFGMSWLLVRVFQGN